MFQTLWRRLKTVAIDEAFPLNALPARVFMATSASPVIADESILLLMIAL